MSNRKNPPSAKELKFRQHLQKGFDPFGRLKLATTLYVNPERLPPVGEITPAQHTEFPQEQSKYQKRYECPPRDVDEIKIFDLSSQNKQNPEVLDVDYLLSKPTKLYNVINDENLNFTLEQVVLQNSQQKKPKSGKVIVFHPNKSRKYQIPIDTTNNVQFIKIDSPSFKPDIPLPKPLVLKQGELDTNDDVLLDNSEDGNNSSSDQNQQDEEEEKGRIHQKIQGIHHLLNVKNRNNLPLGNTFDSDDEGIDFSYPIAASTSSLVDASNHSLKPPESPVESYFSYESSPKRRKTVNSENNRQNSQNPKPNASTEDHVDPGANHSIILHGNDLTIDHEDVYPKSWLSEADFRRIYRNIKHFDPLYRYDPLDFKSIQQLYLQHDPSKNGTLFKFKNRNFTLPISRHKFLLSSWGKAPVTNFLRPPWWHFYRPPSEKQYQFPSYQLNSPPDPEKEPDIYIHHPEKNTPLHKQFIFHSQAGMMNRLERLQWSPSTLRYYGRPGFLFPRGTPIPVFSQKEKSLLVDQKPKIYVSKSFQDDKNQNSQKKCSPYPVEHFPTPESLSLKQQSQDMIFVEYMEEYPIILSLLGMGATLRSYIVTPDQITLQKHYAQVKEKWLKGEATQEDFDNPMLYTPPQTERGFITALYPTDACPFYGYIDPGSKPVLSLETSFSRVPLAKHDFHETDFLLTYSDPTQTHYENQPRYNADHTPFPIRGDHPLNRNENIPSPKSDKDPLIPSFEKPSSQFSSPFVFIFTPPASKKQFSNNSGYFVIQPLKKSPIFTAGEIHPIELIYKPNTNEMQKARTNILTQFMMSQVYTTKNPLFPFSSKIFRAVFPNHTPSNIKQVIQNHCKHFGRNREFHSWKGDPHSLTQQSISNIWKPQNAAMLKTQEACVQRLYDCGIYHLKTIKNLSVQVKKYIRYAATMNQVLAAQIVAKILFNSPWNQSKVCLNVLKIRSSRLDFTSPELFGSTFALTRSHHQERTIGHRIKDDLEKDLKYLETHEYLGEVATAVKEKTKKVKRIQKVPEDQKIEGTDNDLRTKPMSVLKSILRELKVPPSLWANAPRWDLVQHIKTNADKEVRAGNMRWAKYSRENTGIMAQGYVKATLINRHDLEAGRNRLYSVLDTISSTDRQNFDTLGPVFDEFDTEFDDAEDEFDHEDISEDIRQQIQEQNDKTLDGDEMRPYARPGRLVYKSWSLARHHKNYDEKTGLINGDMKQEGVVPAAAVPDAAVPDAAVSTAVVPAASASTAATLTIPAVPGSVPSSLIAPNTIPSESETPVNGESSTKLPPLLDQNPSVSTAPSLILTSSSLPESVVSPSQAVQPFIFNTSSNQPNRPQSIQPVSPTEIQLKSNPSAKSNLQESNILSTSTKLPAKLVKKIPENAGKHLDTSEEIIKTLDPRGNVVYRKRKITRWITATFHQSDISKLYSIPNPNQAIITSKQHFDRVFQLRPILKHQFDVNKTEFDSPRIAAYTPEEVSQQEEYMKKFPNGRVIAKEYTRITHNVTAHKKRKKPPSPEEYNRMQRGLSTAVNDSRSAVHNIISYQCIRSKGKFITSDPLPGTPASHNSAEKFSKS